MGRYVALKASYGVNGAYHEKGDIVFITDEDREKEDKAYFAERFQSVDEPEADEEPQADGEDEEEEADEPEADEEPPVVTTSRRRTTAKKK